MDSATCMGLLIGTGIIMLLEIFLVQPIANHFLAKKLSQPENAYLLSAPAEDEEAVKKIQSLATPSYIMADVVVLGIAGLLMGAVLGLFFIGFSTKLRGWPGMIAFIATSFVGIAMFA